MTSRCNWRNMHPPTAILFFKIILRTSLADGKLKIPNNFTRKYGGGLSNPVFLKPPDGTEWKVYWTKHDGEIWFQKGWKEFATYYSLDHGHLVLFEYEETFHFVVHIFDMSGLEIDYPFHGTQDEKDNLDQSSDDSVKILDELLPCQKTRLKSPMSSPQPRKKLRTGTTGDVERSSNLQSLPQHVQTKGNQSQGTNLEKSPFASVKKELDEDMGGTTECPKVEQLTSTKIAEALNKATTFRSKKPSFMLVMKPSYVDGYSLNVPSQFAENYLKKKHGVILLQVLDGRTWPVIYSLRKISAGWKKFASDNNLNVGDVCVFELTKHGDLSLKVLIFRVAKEPICPLSQSQEQVDGDPEKKNASGNNETEKKNASIAQPTITPSLPYYLGLSDNPGTPLVAVALKGENYRNWARSMKIALCAKTKLCFIDGSVKKPTFGSTDFHNWEKVDSMVTAWIINSCDPTLHSSISHATTARDVWLDLEERFAQTNAPRIHQLWHTLCMLKQESHMSIIDFYTYFKSLIDELGELQPLPQCNCGASKELAQKEQDQQVHLFLGGLDNERFGQVKGTLLNTDPLPSLRRVFNHVLREEARFIADKDREPRTDSGAAFYTSKGKNRDGPRPKCEHCGKIGHEKTRCYKLIGYPTHWNTKRSNRPSSKANLEGGMARLACAENEQGKPTTSEGSTGGHALFGFQTKHAEYMAGKQNWVFDSGASHHMSPLHCLFEDLRHLNNPLHITVPTGNMVVVDKIGTMTLSSKINLQDVLYIPQFACNLISIHKLTHDLQCTVTYSSHVCVIQDQHTRSTIGLGELCDGVYVLKREGTRGSSLAANGKNETTLWHARMGAPFIPKSA